MEYYLDQYRMSGYSILTRSERKIKRLVLQLMTMIPPKILTNFLVLFAAIAVLHSRFCRSQGNRTSVCEKDKCGAFGVCNSQESPICTCLQGFYPRNNQEWSSGNWSSGCQRRVPLNCDARRNWTNDGFSRIQAMWSDYSEMWPARENLCEGRCLTNCSCLAYAYDGTAGCRFWDRPLTDIQKFSSDSASYVFLRLANSELVTEQKKDSKKTILIVVVVGFIVISVCTFSSWKWIAKRRGKRKSIPLGIADTSVEDALSQVNLQDLPIFKFEILANATDNFSEANKLGKGGFGPVYKGTLTNGREIAVKRLAQASGQGMQEFMNEVVLISKLQHRNLVRLHGCCIESKEIMLIYEYMSNKSLDFFLFDSSQEKLDWSKRFNVIEGICRGLLYLHRDSRLKIIHRDLKPSNILLDSDWNPKISDFGMARIFGTKNDHVSTIRVVGTFGYMAPEYAIEGRFSVKSDVFSFGVLILEIATGIRNTSFIHQEDSLNLLGHVWKLWNEENVAGLIDARISSLRYRGEVMRCIHIGLLCVQELPHDRPSVSAVLSMLNSEIIKLPEPKKPAFSIKTIRHDAAGTTSSQQSQKSSSSNNDVTLSMIEGR